MRLRPVQVRRPCRAMVSASRCSALQPRPIYKCCTSWQDLPLSHSPLTFQTQLFTFAVLPLPSDISVAVFCPSANIMEGYYQPATLATVGDPWGGSLSQSLPSRKRVRTQSRPSDLNKMRRTTPTPNTSGSPSRYYEMPSQSQGSDFIDLTG